MPMWRNWQTHTTQNRAGNHVGSSPTIGTRSQTIQVLKYQCLYGFVFEKVCNRLSKILILGKQNYLEVGLCSEGIIALLTPGTDNV